MNTTILIRTKEQALEKVAYHCRLIEIATLEPKKLEHVIDVALMVENPANHWREYERLKSMMAQFVGWDAQHKQIATSQHYEIMIDFIDWLLPSGQEGEMIGAEY